jgi:hypothetical protein
MYTYGELPTDIEDMEESMGPPPAWFRPEIGITTQAQALAYGANPYYGYGYGGLGNLGREGGEEVEVNPIESLQEMKFKQELNKKIPRVANRYTDIQPLSPMFRDKKKKYGFGEVEKRYSIATLLIGASILYFLFFRKAS